MTSTATPPVENAPNETAAATAVADGAIAVLPSIDLEQAKTDLASLTAQAKDAFAESGNAFAKAARALARIRDEKLLDAVHGVDEKGKPNLTFEQFCENEFGVTRDMGDKYARAGLIYNRIIQDLGSDAEQLALPTAETQLRPLGKLLKSDPKKKLFGKVWVEALAEGEKKGFVNKPTVDNVRTALTRKARSFAPNGSTTSGTRGPKTREVHLTDESTAAQKALAELVKSYSDVPVATFRSILLDGIRHAAKHNVTASVVEQDLDALLNPPAETVPEEQNS